MLVLKLAKNNNSFKLNDEIMKTLKRVLLKLSGEALTGDGVFGITTNGLKKSVQEILPAVKKGVEVAIVLGGGNIWRGAGKEMNRVAADYIGMLATVMNAIAMREALASAGVKSVVLSAIDATQIVERYSPKKAIEYLKDGYVVLLAGGTGNPYFTTDTTAALRAVELKADCVLKATQVNGVYSADPKTTPNAKMFSALSFADAIEKNLKVMDISAFALCRDNKMPIYVFNFHKKGNLLKVLSGANIGTKVQ